jgi:hypothetical protein
MGDQHNDDGALIVNSGGDANNPDGHDNNINDADRCARCCFNVDDSY